MPIAETSVRTSPLPVARAQRTPDPPPPPYSRIFKYAYCRNTSVRTSPLPVVRAQRTPVPPPPPYSRDIITPQRTSRIISSVQLHLMLH